MMAAILPMLTKRMQALEWVASEVSALTEQCNAMNPWIS